MKLYSDYPRHRTRQIVADLFALAAIAASVWLGFVIHGLVDGLKSFGAQMEESGSGFRSTMTDISDNLSGIPLIGGGVTTPFDNASNAGKALESAGQAEQVAVHNLAIGLGLGIAALPILTILLFWLVPRLRFAHRAGSARSMSTQPAGVDLLALRALAGQKLSRISAVHPDPMSAWRNGDEVAMRALANLELKSSGVRVR